MDRKIFGELIALFSLFIFLSMTLAIRFIEYSFSLMPGLEKSFLGLNADFWAYRRGSFGNSGIMGAIVLIVMGSLISLKESRKIFFYIEITAFILWLFFIPGALIY